MYYIGIDLGTSAVKGLLIDENGAVLRENSKTYPVFYPRDGWSEQNPEDWFFAVNRLIDELSDGVEEKIAALSVGGQMHGLVVLDGNDNVVRPCILWNDGRTEKQTRYLNEVVGKEFLSENTANIAFAGFTAPKLLWIEENEPQNFKKIRKIMLPKDYIAYRLTGSFTTDFSDASGTLFLDVKNKRWSQKMLDILHIDRLMLPELKESYEVIGRIKDGFKLKGVLVAAGAGDNAAAAIGTGATTNGATNISLGTSGTVFTSCDKFSVGENNSLHAFCHANGKYHLMGCILSAASANKWWIEDILKSKDYEGEVAFAKEKAGNNGVYFLPYLMGERSPHNDVNARGAFIGMRLDTSRQEMSLAVLEGVAFALRDCVEAARSSGLKISSATLCGGGAKSKLWRRIIADVLGAEIMIPEVEQGPGYGAAILAMVAAGEYSSVEEAVKKIVKVKERVVPDKKGVALYEKKYKTYKSLYPCLKEVFKTM